MMMDIHWFLAISPFHSIYNQQISANRPPPWSEKKHFQKTVLKKNLGKFFHRITFVRHHVNHLQLPTSAAGVQVMPRKSMSLNPPSGVGSQPRGSRHAGPMEPLNLMPELRRVGDPVDLG